MIPVHASYLHQQSPASDHSTQRETKIWDLSWLHECDSNAPVTGKLVVLCVPSHINTYQHLPMQPIVPRVLHVQLPANAPCGRLRAGMDWELL